MNLEAVARAEARLLLPTYDRKRVLFRRGQGCYLWDDHGRRYLDWLSGIGVCALGYNHPAVLATIRKQAPRLVHISNLFYHDYQAALARAADQALRAATARSSATAAARPSRARSSWRAPTRGCTTRTEARRRGGFSPWRIPSTAAPRARWRQPRRKNIASRLSRLLPGVRFVKFNNVADLEKKFDGSVCAVLIEPIQGEGGINPVTPEFFARARKLADKHGALLIADEIQCGLGRTGEYFAFQKYGVTPDILALAKPLASGLPLGAILTREHVAAAIKPGLHGTTFGGGPLACAVAITFLDTLQREKRAR